MARSPCQDRQCPAGEVANNRLCAGSGAFWYRRQRTSRSLRVRWFVEGVNPMSIAVQIARQFREAYLEGSWTAVSLRDVLADVDWRQATAQVGSLHTIAELVYHVDYFVAAVLEVLQGRPLDAHDKYSFDVAPINSQEDWDQLLAKVWADAGQFVELVERLPDNRLTEDMADPKYGSWYRNLCGIIEHTYYHLGQMVIIKKTLAMGDEAA